MCVRVCVQGGGVAVRCGRDGSTLCDVDVVGATATRLAVHDIVGRLAKDTQHLLGLRALIGVLRSCVQ